MQKRLFHGIIKNIGGVQMKIVKLNSQAFDNYVSSIDYCNYFQTTGYAFTINKFGLKEEFFGFEENGKLVGALLLLSKQVFMGFKYGYSPRGIIIDYNDENLVKNAVKELKNKLLKEHFIIFKMDPLIIHTIRDKKGNIIERNDKYEKSINILKNAGFTHKGSNLYFEGVKPRFEAELDLQKDSSTLFKNLTKQIRNKLRKATKYGLSVYKDNKMDFDKIYPLIKDKDTVPLKYYGYLYNNFKDDLEIYYAKLNTKVYVENSKYLYEKEMEINDYLTNIIQSNGYKGKNMSDVLSKKMESDKLLTTYKKYMVQATDLLKEHPDGIIVGATVTLKYKNKIFLIVEGFDKEYKNLNSTYLTKWKIIEKYANSDIKTFNMNALVGNFTKENNEYKGLNEMKFSYNAEALEYAGEFELIINNPIYSIYKTMVPKK